MGAPGLPQGFPSGMPALPPGQDLPDLSKLNFDQFKDECLAPVGVFESVDRSDVRVVERGEHMRFALEPREALRVVREGGQQDLDRDLAMQLRIARTIHRTHSAFTE